MTDYKTKNLSDVGIKVCSTREDNFCKFHFLPVMITPKKEGLECAKHES
jgi:hypothetical protein